MQSTRDKGHELQVDMRTKRTMVLLTVVLGVLLSRDALAFYNPSTGRWLSRDPIGEQGFASVQKPNSRRRSRSGWSRSTDYVIAVNDVVGRRDYLGLSWQMSGACPAAEGHMELAGEAWMWGWGSDGLGQAWCFYKKCSGTDVKYAVDVQDVGEWIITEEYWDTESEMCLREWCRDTIFTVTMKWRCIMCDYTTVTYRIVGRKRGPSLYRTIPVLGDRIGESHFRAERSGGPGEAVVFQERSSRCHMEQVDKTYYDCGCIWL